MSTNDGWIGVDLDGTLAHYEGWNGGVIGEPIVPMVRRVQQWLAQGKDVRIFTARVYLPKYATPEARTVHQQQRVAIAAWCQLHLGQVLPITNQKDFSMIELWDDRAVQVVNNLGLRADGRD